MLHYLKALGAVVTHEVPGYDESNRTLNLPSSYVCYLKQAKFRNRLQAIEAGLNASRGEYMRLGGNTLFPR